MSSWFDTDNPYYFLMQVAFEDTIPLGWHVDLTYRCDLSCSHCYLEDRRRREMTVDEYREFFAELADLGCLYLLVSGGDLFVRPDAMEILRAAARHQFDMTLITHAMAIDEGKEPLLQEMIEQWPFFYFFMDMLDMVLSKADLRVSAYYDDCLADENVKELGKELRKKLQLTKDVAEHIVKDQPVEEERQVLRASVFVRNPYADPLNMLQGEVLLRIKHNESENVAVLEDALMVTIAGIAAAMKNTG